MRNRKVKSPIYPQTELKNSLEQLKKAYRNRYSFSGTESDQRLAQLLENVSLNFTRWAQSIMPWTPLGKRYSRVRFFHNCRDLFDMFDLWDVDSGKRKQLRKSSRYIVANTSVLFIIHKNTDQAFALSKTTLAILRSIGLLVGLVFYSASDLFSDAFKITDNPLFSHISSYLLSLFLYIFGYFLALKIHSILASLFGAFSKISNSLRVDYPIYLETIEHAVWTLSLLALIYYSTTSNFYYKEFPLYCGVFSFIYSALVYYGILTLLWILYMQLDFALVKFKNFALIDGVAFVRLLVLIDLLLKNPEKWDNVVFKYTLVTHLEGIARIFHPGMPRIIKSGDIATDIWYSERMLEIASAFRDLKKWVLTPQDGSRTALIEKLQHNTLILISGNKDELDRADPSQYIIKVPILVQFLAGLRRIIVAVAPLAGIVAYGHYFMKEPLPPTWAGLSIAWLIVNLLVAVDPNLKEKVAAFKDLKEIVPTMGKDK